MVVIDLVLLAAGIALLLASGEALVRGAVALSRRAGISPLVIGLTVVAFGTSAPELVVSVHAALVGAPGIALGNIVGSNIANLLLILGAAAALWPMAVHRDALRRDGMIMLAASLVFALLLQTGTVDRLHGAILLVLLAAYVWWSLRSDRRDRATAALHGGEAQAAEQSHGTPRTSAGMAASLVGGLAGLVVGARLTVDGASALARAVGIPEEVIGLTLVAVGTSLPELVTALVAARRGETDVCVGNLVGSNTFNLLGIGGAAALAAPLGVPVAIARFDVWVMLGVAALATGFMLTGRRVVRAEGWLLLAAYTGYVVWLLSGA